MTSTSTPSDPLASILSRQGHTPLRSESDRSPQVGPARGRSRFPLAPVPAGSADEMHRALWAGPDAALRELVADHATAAGLELVDEADTGPIAVQLMDAAALVTAPGTAGFRSRGASVAAGMPPLLVVTGEQVVTTSAWRSALASGARALLQLPADSEQLLSHLSELSRPRSDSTVIGVAAGHGGAGASSFAARLAAAARPEGPVVLIDGDPLGGGLDLLVEHGGAAGVGWSDLEGLGSQDGTALREGLPVVDEVALLVAGDGPGPQASALSRALTALAPGGGTVVVDLSASLVAAAAEHLDRLLLVTTATDHAVRATARRLDIWPLPAGLVSVVVRRQGPLHPGDIAADLSLPLAAAFRDSPAGTVPLLDVRRRGADRSARVLLQGLRDGGAS
ncbi:MAG TPA: hypothetical protein H9786_11740 [Candidatus Brachybacterium merdavium]|uniref:Rv3660c-like CheY-like N-terminal domain-containing protein n=1 Tax=Candidatus Brachybacterium merdavium TaxID=2838513 RepID=A0A9D2LEU3_9MICO|nr:hypothetical protein [Candidatus Brachybacterium merdavium]